MENTVEEEAAAKAKLARKRSRCFSPPYTFADDVFVCGHRSEELMVSCTNVAAADMLSALHAAALLDAGAGVEVLRRFFTLHRNSSSSSRDTAEAELSPSSSSQKKKEISPDKKKRNAAAAAASTPTRRLPLTDVRNNLEEMISSLLGLSPTPTTSHGAKLAGEMRCLLAKVDKMLAAAATTSTAAHRH